MSCRVQADFRAVNRPLILAYQRLRSRRGVANSTVACGPHTAWDSLITRYYSSRSYALTAAALPAGLVNSTGQAVVSVSRWNLQNYLDGITHHRANYRI